MCSVGMAMCSLLTISRQCCSGMGWSSTGLHWVVMRLCGWHCADRMGIIKQVTGLGHCLQPFTPSFDRPWGLQTPAPLQITGGHHDSGGWLLLCRVCHQIGVRFGGKPILPTPHPSLHFCTSHLHGGHQQSTVAFCFQANSFRQIPMISPHILATNIAALFAPNSNNGQWLAQWLEETMRRVPWESRHSRLQSWIERLAPPSTTTTTTVM